MARKKKGQLGYLPLHIKTKKQKNELYVTVHCALVDPKTINVKTLCYHLYRVSNSISQMY